MASRDKTTKPHSAKPSSGKTSGVSKKPGVKFDISEEDLDKASGGGAATTTERGLTPNEGIASVVCLTRSGRG
jgi:hypothetical protein